MKVKICGITNLEDALLCYNQNVDILGFIFYKGSKRFIEPNKAANIIASLPPFIITTGVFVNETVENIQLIKNQTNIDFIQLHGNESKEYLKSLKYKNIIKAFRVNNSYSDLKIEEFTDTTCLFDSYSDNNYGGTGISFDKDIIPIDLYKKSIISGGISLDNIELIMNKYKPMAIDICSSVECFPGKKDKIKLEELMNFINSRRFNDANNT